MGTLFPRGPLSLGRREAESNPAELASTMPDLGPSVVGIKPLCCSKSSLEAHPGHSGPLCCWGLWGVRPRSRAPVIQAR